MGSGIGQYCWRADRAIAALAQGDEQDIDDLGTAFAECLCQPEEENQKIEANY